MVSVSMVLSCKDDSSQPPVSQYHLLEPPKLHNCHYSHFIIWLFALIPQFHQLSAFNIWHDWYSRWYIQIMCSICP